MINGKALKFIKYSNYSVNYRQVGITNKKYIGEDDKLLPIK
jgi:hypothetical protein